MSEGIQWTGINNRIFGLQFTGSGERLHGNVDVGWNWNNMDGAGAYLRSSDWDDGAFGFFARNASGTTKQLVGKTDGTLTWDGNAIIHAGNISSHIGSSLNARYVTGDSNASSPQGALLRSGTGRPDASPSGDTWIFYDDCGSYSSPWGIRANQAANTIGFVGAGNEYASINLSNGYYSGSVSWSNVTSKSLGVFEYNNVWVSPSRLQLMRYSTDTYSDRACVGVTNGNLHIDSYHGYDLYLNFYSSGNIRFGYQTSSYYFTPSGTGYFSSYYITSDRSNKKNIKNISKSSLKHLFNVSDKLFKSFEFKDSDKLSYGFVAQELEKYIPEAIQLKDDNTKSVNYNVAYAKIIASIINDSKKKDSRIKSLEEKVEYLLSKVK